MEAGSDSPARTGKTGGGVPPAGLWKPRFDPGGAVLAPYPQTRGTCEHRLRDVFALEAAGRELVVGKPRERLETMRQRSGVLDTFEEGAEAVADPLQDRRSVMNQVGECESSHWYPRS